MAWRAWAGPCAAATVACTGCTWACAVACTAAAVPCAWAWSARTVAAPCVTCAAAVACARAATVACALLPAAYLLQLHAATFKDFPPRQAPADFNPQAMLDRVLRVAAAGIGNS